MTLASPLDTAAQLRAAGLRVTRPREVVLDVLSRGGHLSADDVLRAARGVLGSLSTQAGYDVLAALTTAGLIRRIEPANSPARYEIRAGDNHHHVVCRRCGATADVDCAVGAAPCLEPSSPGGFTIDEAEVTFWGLCPTCQATEVPAQRESPPPRHEGAPPHDRRSEPAARDR